MGGVWKERERGIVVLQEREYRRQRMARQRELETERKAKERTSRLLAHLRQQVPYTKNFREFRGFRVSRKFFCEI